MLIRTMPRPNGERVGVKESDPDWSIYESLSEDSESDSSSIDQVDTIDDYLPPVDASQPTPSATVEVEDKQVHKATVIRELLNCRNTVAASND